MVVLAQGPGPFVSRRESISSEVEAAGFSQINAEFSSYEQGRRPIERFDFSSSLFFNFSEENPLSLEGPPAADALFVLSAWIQ